MKNFSIKRFTASLLFIVMVVAALPVSLFNFTISASAADSETIYVLAGGDFQAGDNGQDDHYYSRINMGNILDKIKENYSTMNGFIFVGDYDGDTHNDSNANAGVAAMMEEVSERFSTLNHDNSYLIEGNHETGAVSGIDATGGYDCDGYAVYLINETDFCERQEGKSAQIQTVADNLKTWLNNKIGEGYEAPIFVATHTPLGYTTRTYTNGDSLYGKYVFDVLNDAAANGLNIIFMHGHDHAWGADNYLGGEAIYLPVGDKINIAVPGDKTAWTEETLNFTYMNAGYVGYYNEDYYNVNSYEAEKLTMTVFKIENNQVTVERWSKDGLYNLKSKGREGFYSNASTCAEIGLDYNETVYASPQTITLNAAQDYGSTIGSWVGVAAETPADDVTTSGNSWVTITAPVPGTEATPASTSYKYTLDTDGIVKDRYDAELGYLIVGSSNYAMTGSGSIGATGVTVTDNTITLDAQPAYEWRITSDNKITNGTYWLKFTGSTSGFLHYTPSGSISLVTSESDATAWTITHDSDGSYNVQITYSYSSWGQSSSATFYLRYSSNTFNVTNSSNTVRLFGGEVINTPATEATPDTNGLYGKIVGELTCNVALGTDRDAALAAVMAGIDGYYYEAMSTPGSDVTGTKVDDSVLTWTLDSNYNGNVPGDYAVTISYNGTVLGTAEVVVPASTTYYVAEGNGLYIVDMNTSADDAMAAVKAGVTVYSATDANGTNKTAVSDDDVTWNWVDTYNGADSGPYTVEILKDGTSLGTVEVKVNIKYETGLNEGWTAVGTTSGGYRYVLDTDGIDYYDANDATTQYIIVANGAAYAVNGSGGAAAVEISSDGSTVTTTTRDYEYHFIRSTYNNTRYELITKGDGSQYLYQENSALHYGTRSSVKFQINHHGSGIYDIHDIDGTNWYITYSGGWTVVNDTSARVRLYKYDGEIVGGDIYAMLEGNTVYTVEQGTSATQALAAVKAGITGYISSNADGSGATELADNQLTWKWKNTYASMVTGSYWVEISYNGVVLGTVEVIVEPGVVNNYPEYPDEGAVKVNKTATGIDFQSSGIAQIELSASGVSIKKGVDVIIMLDTSSSMAYCLDCNDTKHDGTDNYKCDQGGQTRAQALEATLADLIEQFQTPGDDGQLLDIDVAIADFNGFYGDSHSESGTPYDRDAADMMSDDISYTANSEAQIYTGDNTLGAGAFIAAEDLAASYTLNYTSGTNYDYAMDAIYQMATAKKIANGSEDRDLYVLFLTDGAAMQWNGYHSQGNSSLWNHWITGAWSVDELRLNCTTHAYYYDEVDHDGDGIINEHRMANAIKGDPTELYEVIRKTNDLGDATDEENMYMVPGLGAKMFSIAFDPRVDGNVTVQSLVNSVATIASDQTSTTQYFYNVSSADELANAFTAIGAEIAYAASNARFVDQLGGSFNLQMATSTYTVVDGDTTTTKTLAPVIEILSYDIWTRSDYLNGTITEDKIGDRKGTSYLTEVVKFSDDGTKAYSNLIDVDKDGVYGVTINSDGTYTISDTDDNIIGTDGIIYAKSFVYNTTSTGVAVEGVAYPQTTNSDGTTSNNSNVLPAETFYWNMGTVHTSELAMRYYVYLDGSMEGTKEAGSYATNEFAVLYYDNYLGNACYKDTTSPTISWKSANVSYAFYLVNEDGKIIVNQTTGATGSFANKVAITNPVVYQEILLNNIENIGVLEVAALGENVLPTYYTVYDGSAAYTVNIRSNGAGNWIITQGNGKVASTYVTHYKVDDASAYSNALINDSVGDDYTHTVVWFAVVWKPQAHPDSVVIDYGLPVDISVLTNDMFGENGKLEGVGAASALPADYDNGLYHDATLASGFGSSYTGTYGVATADTTTGKVRYTLNTSNGMQMDTYEKFAYAVNYTGSENAGYYYDTITIIPATIIYYEESFVNFVNGYTVTVQADGTTDKDTAPQVADSKQVSDGTEAYGDWVKVGTEINNATQAEDRPGQYSLSSIDANNLYGYDGVYSEITKYSLGTAMQATVNKIENTDGSYTTTGYNGKAPTATFTFTGTGFDIISLTDSDSGMIRINVTDQSGTTVYSDRITNYYGMNYQQLTNADGSAQVDDEGNPVYGWVSTEKGAIYQVPVIKKTGLTYGTYTVTIQVGYMSFFDQDNGGSGDGEYYFVLDAIRIYDPSNGGAADGTTDTTIEDAYKADGEANAHYLMVKEAILGQAELENLSPDNLTGTLSGAVFIDGKESTTSVSDYANPGPNNEAYLGGQQSISFKLIANAKPTAVHMGAKLAYGTSVSATLTHTDDNGKITFNEEFKTTTDMYYDITDYIAFTEGTDADGNTVWTTGTITIINNAAEGNYDSILSLTNIKATFESATVLTGSAGDGTTVTEETTSEVSAYASTGTYSLMSARMMTLDTTETATEEPVSISFLVDAEVIEDACAVMTELYAPEPEVFVPEVLEYTVSNGFFGYSTVVVITSKDVASITVNGVEATKISGSRMFSSMLKLFSGLAKELGITSKTTDYDIWNVSLKRTSSYEIVAVNADGLSTDPTLTDSSTSITKEDVESFFDRERIFEIMEEIANQTFDPEQFETYINERFDGMREIITQTSEDVEYVIIDGKIVDRYITETVIDTETGETTTKRVWITDAEDDVEDEEVEVNAYDRNGVGSESKWAERKHGFRFGSNSENENNNSNNGNSNSDSDKNNKENNGKGNSGKYGRM